MGEVKREATRAARSEWARWLARAGLVAKGITFGLVAARKLANADYGQVLLGCTAAGLMAYALFCLVQARYREV